MIATRKRRGMNQAQLGARVATSQNMISLIESGKLPSSSFILAICKVLRIPLPMHSISDEQRRWALVGHLLEEDSPAEFEAALKFFEARVADKLAAIESAQIEDAKPTPVAAPVVGQKPDRHAGSQPLRTSDELPIEAAERKKKK